MVRARRGITPLSRRKTLHDHDRDIPASELADAVAVDSTAEPVATIRVTANDGMPVTFWVHKRTQDTQGDCPLTVRGC